MILDLFATPASVPRSAFRRKRRRGGADAIAHDWPKLCSEHTEDMFMCFCPLGTLRL